MSYTIEVYKKKYKAEKHLGIYALYVMFYPQLVAGPIERPYGLLPQFHLNHKFETNRVFDGLKLMLWGFFKKVVIADRLATLVNPVYGDPTSHSGLVLLLATYCFAIQILCDFSGYSDIAIGIAQIMGFNLRENFNRPYLSKSISEFWTRWHISLSTWFRDYVYIPLGGNRVTKFRWYLNIILVFLVSGLWHGADWKFVLWGGLHGIYLIVGSLLSKFKFKINSILAMAVTFNLVSIAWIFFRAESVKDAFIIIQKIFSGLLAFRIAASDYVFIHQNQKNILIGLVMIGVMEIIYLINKNMSIRHMLNNKPIVLRWSIYYLLLFLIIFFGVFSETKFIYFQF